MHDNYLDDARRAYNAYGEFVEWRNYAGLAMPKWEDLTDKIRGAWMHATGTLLQKPEEAGKTSSFANLNSVGRRIAGILTGTSDDNVSDLAWMGIASYICDHRHLLTHQPTGFDVVAFLSTDRQPGLVAPELPADKREELNELVVSYATTRWDYLGAVFSAAPPTSPHGIYDHFKGGVYLSTGTSEWASGDCEPVVEYIALTNGRKYTRIASEWQALVRWPDGKYRSRFLYRGPDLNVQAPSFKVTK